MEALYHLHLSGGTHFIGQSKHRQKKMLVYGHVEEDEYRRRSRRSGYRMDEGRAGVSDGVMAQAGEEL